MGRNHRTREINVRVIVSLNAQETALIDRLLDTGLWGFTRGAILRRLADLKLMEVFGPKEKTHSRV